MAKVDINNIMDEILWFLRNNITDPKTPDRASSQTDEFNGNGATKAFTLTKTPASNVTTVTIGGTGQTFGTDYAVSINETTNVGTVTMTVAPGTGSDNVDITYNYGTKWIYPDMPRSDLRLESFPRISLSIVSNTVETIGLNADGFMTSILLNITAYGADDNEVRSILNEVKDDMMDNKKSFFYFNFIKPVNLSPLIRYENDKTEIVQQTITMEIPFLFEV